MDEVDVLLCQERQTCLEGVGGGGEPEADENGTSEDDRYVEILLQRETSFGTKGTDLLEFNDTVQCARLEALAWILKTRAVFRFRYETAYLSLSYFDRFLSRRIINNGTLWACKLLTVACLSLAAKVEELTVPALSELQFEGYNFESSVIRRMELLVLNTLDWKMISVTPFTFIHHLTTKLCREIPSTHIASSSVEFIFSFIREESLINHRPSAIAASAVLMSMDPKLTRKSLELKLNSISHYKAVEFEDVVVCYNFMQKMKVERLEGISKLENSLGQVRRRDVTESPSITAAVSASCKRRRLKF